MRRSPDTGTAIRAAAVATVVLSAAALVAGCGWDPTQPKRLTAPCGVVVDGSASGARLNVKQLLDGHIDDFLFDNKCRRVAFAPITAASEQSQCNKPEVDIDPDDLPAGADRDATRTDGRNQAKKAAQDMLTCAQQDQNAGSDVVGGLRRVVNERPKDQGIYRVLVLSDFAQNDRTMNLYRENLADRGRRAELIRKLSSMQRIPDLSGVRLTIYGFAIKISNRPDKRGPFETFWTELITGPAKGAKPTFTN